MEQDKKDVYKSTNSDSSAVGKYQFLWGDEIKEKNTGKRSGHHTMIMKVTGVKSKEEFLNSPEAQEKYMQYVYEHDYKPTINKLKSQYNGMSDDLLSALLHFQGEGGTKVYLSTFFSKLKEFKGDVDHAHAAAQHSLNQLIKKNNGGVLPKNSTVQDYLTKFLTALYN